MTESSPGRGRALLAAAVTVVLWASAFVVIRTAGADFSPGALALGRLASGSVVLVALLLLLGEVPATVASAGGVLCLVGVAITRWQPRARRSPAVSPDSDLDADPV
ncbi:hypothetical protein [Nocardia sp. NPDC002869]|uniref:hypothetical protein n=1 Tax=Nocardia sp. NPDC002869 TaxID=3161032 RepID=UPI00398D6716